MAKAMTPRRWGKGTVSGGFLQRFDVTLHEQWDVNTAQMRLRYTIIDRRLMKRVDNFHTDDLDEALALCKLMNEGEKL